jgi:iron complex outermembrane recepter protein
MNIVIGLLVSGFCLLPSALPASAPPSALQVSGTVRAIDGAVIAGATVVVRDASREQTVTTDASGKFVVPNVVPPATVDITVRGFAPVHQAITGDTIDIVLTPASVTSSVVVVAGMERSIWRDPQTGATALAREDLDRIPSVTTDEALRVVSGFSLFRRSTSRASNPTTHGVTMRGLSASGASRAAILLDGIPLNDGFGGWVTWTRLPPSAIDYIRIDRGAAGDAFGSDALGGVVRIVGQTGRAPSVSLAALGGSTSVAGIDIAGGRPFGRVSAFGATSWYRTDGVIPVSKEQRGIVDKPGDADWVNAFGRTAVGSGGRRLTVTGWGGRDDRGNGTVLQRNRMSGGTGAVSFESLTGQGVFAARVSVSPNAFYQTFTTVATSRATETLTSTQTTETTTTRALVEYGRSFGFAYLLARGTISRADGTFQEVRPTITVSNDLRDNSEAISVQAGYIPTEAMTIYAGVRHEWRAAPTTGDTRDGTTVGHLAAAVELAPRLHVRGSVASSHRWPTLNELVRNFQAGNILTQANPALEPEQSVAADAAVSVDGRRWQATAGYFWSVVDGAIANVTLTSTLRQRRNTGEAHARGMELDAEVRPLSGVRIRGSATFADARFLHSIEAPLEGKRLPQVPRWSGSISGDVTFLKIFVASAAWHGVSNQFDDDLNRFLLTKGYQLDFRVAGKHGRVGWHLDVDNAFDARVEVGRSGSVTAPLITVAPGRLVRFAVTWRK